MDEKNDQTQFSFNFRLPEARRGGIYPMPPRRQPLLQQVPQWQRDPRDGGELCPHALEEGAAGGGGVLEGLALGEQLVALPAQLLPLIEL